MSWPVDRLYPEDLHGFGEGVDGGLVVAGVVFGFSDHAEFGDTGHVVFAQHRGFKRGVDGGHVGGAVEGQRRAGDGGEKGGGEQMFHDVLPDHLSWSSLPILPQIDVDAFHFPVARSSGSSPTPTGRAGPHWLHDLHGQQDRSLPENCQARAQEPG